MKPLVSKSPPRHPSPAAGTPRTRPPLQKLVSAAALAVACGIGTAHAEPQPTNPPPSGPRAPLASIEISGPSSAQIYRAPGGITTTIWSTGDGILPDDPATPPPAITESIDVPEPAALTLLLSGALYAALARRRR